MTIVYSCFLTGMLGLVSLLTLWPGIVGLNFVPADWVFVSAGRLVRVCVCVCVRVCVSVFVSE